MKGASGYRDSRNRRLHKPYFSLRGLCCIQLRGEFLVSIYSIVGWRTRYGVVHHDHTYKGSLTPSNALTTCSNDVPDFD